MFDTEGFCGSYTMISKNMELTIRVRKKHQFYSEAQIEEKYAV